MIINNNVIEYEVGNTNSLVFKCKIIGKLKCKWNICVI